VLFGAVMYEVSVEKTQSELHDLIDSVVNGEEIIFTQDDLPIAKLVAVRNDKPRPQFGSAKGLFVLARDFNEPLEDFDEYR
jgi:antitoxin (DNA-binding transcriptional repressor) of toxin-antitoxin stability system